MSRIGATELLALLAERAGIDWTKLGKRFDIRKRFQKTIFLLQNRPFDLDMGYSFNLYLHGPYSPALASVSYEIAKDSERLKGFVSGRTFHRGVTRKLNKFNQFAEEGSDHSGLNTADFLELASTILFIYRFCLTADEKDKATRAAERASEIKPWFSSAARRSILAVMRKYRLLA